jgi:hypothetical protein
MDAAAHTGLPLVARGARMIESRIAPRSCLDVREAEGVVLRDAGFVGKRGPCPGRRFLFDVRRWDGRREASSEKIGDFVSGADGRRL